MLKVPPLRREVNTPLLERLLLRAAGNYEVHIRSHFEREIEKAIERELGDKQLERERPLIRTFGNPAKIAKKIKDLSQQMFGGKSDDNQEAVKRDRENDADKQREPEKENEKEKQLPDAPDKSRRERDDKERDKGDDDFKKRRR